MATTASEKDKFRAVVAHEKCDGTIHVAADGTLCGAALHRTPAEARACPRASGAAGVSGGGSGDHEASVRYTRPVWIHVNGRGKRCVGGPHGSEAERDACEAHVGGVVKS